jgi:hypothetical protein
MPLLLRAREDPSLEGMNGHAVLALMGFMAGEAAKRLRCWGKLPKAVNSVLGSFPPTSFSCPAHACEREERAREEDLHSLAFNSSSIDGGIALCERVSWQCISFMTWSCCLISFNFPLSAYVSGSLLWSIGIIASYCLAVCLSRWPLNGC